jgi:hypothetical protein
MASIPRSQRVASTVWHGRRRRRSSEDVAIDDQRYLMVDGRRWRRSAPRIPEALRRELVSALMSARRAVLAAKRSSSAIAEKTARARVQDAKVALGERGRPYWDSPDDKAERQRAAATLRALLAARGPGKTICPSDVARAIGADRWRSAMSLVREAALVLVAKGELEVRQQGKRVDPEQAHGPIRYAAKRPGRRK